jgi:hypothetical protein
MVLTIEHFTEVDDEFIRGFRKAHGEFNVVLTDAAPLAHLSRQHDYGRSVPAEYLRGLLDPAKVLAIQKAAEAAPIPDPSQPPLQVYEGKLELAEKLVEGGGENLMTLLTKDEAVAQQKDEITSIEMISTEPRFFNQITSKLFHRLPIQFYVAGSPMEVLMSQSVVNYDFTVWSCRVKCIYEKWNMILAERLAMLRAAKIPTLVLTDVHTFNLFIGGSVFEHLVKDKLVFTNEHMGVLTTSMEDIDHLYKQAKELNNSTAMIDALSLIWILDRVLEIAEFEEIDQDKLEEYKLSIVEMLITYYSTSETPNDVFDLYTFYNTISRDPFKNLAAHIHINEIAAARYRQIGNPDAAARIDQLLFELIDVKSKSEKEEESDDEVTGAAADLQALNVPEVAGKTTSNQCENKC